MVPPGSDLGPRHLVSREASSDTQQAPEKYLVNFTEMSKGLAYGF